MAAMRKILLVDDNRDIGKLVGIAARALGAVCIETSNAESFLAEATPDVTLILLDLRMPGMDGIELLGKLGRRNSTVEIVLMSGIGTHVLETAEHIAESLGFRVVGRLEKPFRIADLQTILRKHLESGAVT